MCSSTVKPGTYGLVSESHSMYKETAEKSAGRDPDRRKKAIPVAKRQIISIQSHCLKVILKRSVVYARLAQETVQHVRLGDGAVSCGLPDSSTLEKGNCFAEMEGGT